MSKMILLNIKFNKGTTESFYVNERNSIVGLSNILFQNLSFCHRIGKSL